MSKRLKHAKAQVRSFNTGTSGHAVEQGEKLCNSLRGRFDAVILEKFILLFQVCLVNCSNLH